MTCHELQDLLVAYAADELAPAQQEFVALHLEQCPACRAALADLALTRRQLQRLREDSWQPQLAGQISRRIQQRRLWQSVAPWARGAVALAAVATVAALAFRQVPLTGGYAPAAPVIVERGDQLYRGNTAYEGRVLAKSPDGRTVYLARYVSEEEFAIDRVDMITGRLIRDQAPKSGRVRTAAISQDGQELYVIGLVGNEVYLKVISTRDSVLAKYYLLKGFTADSKPLPLPDGKRLVIAGQDRLARIDLSETEVSLSIAYPGMTSDAALTQDGPTLVAVIDGRLIALDTLLFMPTK